ncbi:MAG: DUF1284 domain-containing protein [Coriobacteriia bacterium]|jgi:hypothetical protein|nr:DUF1284 domain-containing protein [Coriobacteriia bacterium]
MDDNTVRIRGHHLVCMQFLHAEVYSAEFGHHLFGIIDRMSRGAPSTVVIGPDDVCAGCPARKSGTCAQEPDSEDAIRVLDALACEMLDLTPGEEFEWGVTSLSVQRILERWRALACDGCEWESRCRPLMDRATGQVRAP